MYIAMNDEVAMGNKTKRIKERELLKKRLVLEQKKLNSCGLGKI